MSYFEFDEVRRIHQPYTDPYWRVPVWKPAPFMNATANMKRGSTSAVTVAWLMEPILHFSNHVEILHQFYEWPKNRGEYNIFLREVTRLPKFWPELWKKMTFGTLQAIGDNGVKFATWQHFFGGTWSPAEFADPNAFKYFVCAQLTAITTCWTGIPFEMARRAYYADKTWPVELRRNYRSPISALFRIPFQEGPLYLFRGGLPIAGANYLLMSHFFLLYPWLKNKFFFMWVYNEFPYWWCKFWIMSFSMITASLLSYPLYFARTLVDIWPKERGGHCTWNNSYKLAMRWMYENIEVLYTNFFPGYWRWMARKGFPFVLTAWIADELGMFSNNYESYGSLEVQFPIQSEAV